MLVQCPGCRTTYRVSEKAITSPDPTFRCSRCKHVFVVGLKNEVTSAPEKAPQPSDAREEHEYEEENREFNFSFAPPKKDEPSPIPHETAVTAPTDEHSSLGSGARIEFDSPGETENGRSDARDSEQLLISDESRSLQTKNAADGETDSNPTSNAEEDKTNPPVEPEGSQPLSTLPYLTLFCCLLLIFSLLTFAHQVQPEPIDDFIKRIPWFGDTVFRNSHLRNGIALQSVRPSIQKLVGNREVFVVAGIAANHNRTSVRQVRIEGRAYNADGREIERQTIAVGNAISEKIIRDMTAQELSILQQLGSQKRFEILPNETANFALVFLKPAKEIKKFSCWVVAAEAAG